MKKNTVMQSELVARPVMADLETIKTSDNWWKVDDTSQVVTKEDFMKTYGSDLLKQLEAMAV